MPAHDFSIREQTFGNNRYELLQEFLTRLADAPFNDIYVEDVCQEVGISKVTFFKYFYSKEEIVYYFILKWEYERSYELHQNMYHGRAGIEHIFSSMCQEPFACNLMQSIVQYLSKAGVPNLKTIISPYEYWLFHRHAYEADIKPLTTDKIFSHYLDEMGLDPNKKMDMCTLMATVLYGTPIISNLCAGQNGLDLEELYHKNLALIFHGGYKSE